MASDAPHKQEFRIRDLATRSVILFPTRAQIIRDIKEITLHPGSNQIIIDGLAPTVDEHSIKVEGTGAATITEVTVDLLPNRDVWEDIYPSDSEDEDSDEGEQSEVETEDMKALNDRLNKLNVQLLSEQEKINSGAHRLKICDAFGKSVEKERPAPSDLDKLINSYQAERERIYQDHEHAVAALETIQEDIEKVNKDKAKLTRSLVKANEKAEREKQKLREKKARKQAEIRKEKLRIKAERELFWPKKVYRITINLEPTSLTPASSRRSSIDGDTVVNLATSTFHEPSTTPLKIGEISLSLSYITYSASWSPRYDLSLNTVKCTGLLEYGAELKNTTSETWRDAKIVLSTSQTTFSGLSETIPILEPWHVRLLKGGRNPDSALFSESERLAKQQEWSKHTGEQSQKPRSEIFGLDGSSSNTASSWYSQEKKRAVPAQATISTMSSHAGPVQSSSMFGTQQARGGLFGSSAGPAGGFGSTAQSQAQNFISIASAHSGPKMRRSSAAPSAAKRKETNEPEPEDELETQSLGSERMDLSLFEDQPRSLTFEEGAWEETGMSTTYDIPNLKTLAPRNSTSKHKIAKIDFKNVIFSHIVIGKLRQVAFLKARLRNTSKITLLKGPLGLTLDGSFLGQASFPRCSAGESFSLPLGVDPAITITYPKPTVRRSQSGIFNKEDSNVFSRSVVILNTKPSAAIELTVLDQIPVSEDERLKIEILNPRGLKAGGDGVPAGISSFTGLAPVNTGSNGKGTAKDVRASVYGIDGKEFKEGKWGSAIASAKKGGEVSWNVKLNPGQGVRLVLEYEASFPAGETVVGVQVNKTGFGNNY
ncbi:hypothetical protein N431DRAFT_426097 [Stipitochalara longipes BDJ]|nr:hypothetical protein N431DRAFT_426097 [Stipitochalara longipes BDJ]